MPTSDLFQNFDYKQLSEVLSGVQDDDQLFDKIVNAPFAYPLQSVRLYLGIVVLLQVDKAAGTINRIALSDTELAQNTTHVSEVPFHEIKIALDEPKNIIAQAIRIGLPTHTDDWKYLFIPAIDAEGARINQASAGIAASTVYPLKSRDGGAMIFSYFQYSRYLDESQEDFMRHYTALVDDALDRSVR